MFATLLNKIPVPIYMPSISWIAYLFGFCHSQLLVFYWSNLTSQTGWMYLFNGFNSLNDHSLAFMCCKAIHFGIAVLVALIHCVWILMLCNGKTTKKNNLSAVMVVQMFGWVWVYISGLLWTPKSNLCSVISCCDYILSRSQILLMRSLGCAVTRNPLLTYYR